MGFATTAETADGASHPPGIAIDPPAELPTPQERGHSSQGLLVLKARRGPDEARRVVRELLSAVVREDISALRSVLDNNAAFRRTFAGQGEDAVSVWLTRFSLHDYGSPGARRVTERELDVFSESDLSRYQGRHPVGVGDDEYAVRLRPRTLRDLFGEELWFVVAEREPGFRITQLIEDYSPR